MYTNEFTGQSRQCSPTAVGVLNVLGRDTSLKILTLLQDDAFTLSELARSVDTSKSVVYKYITRLMSAGFVSDGDGRPLPQQKFLRHHLMKPLIAEVTGMGFTYAPMSGLDYYVDYYGGERKNRTIFPRVEKSDTQLRLLNVNSGNVVCVFNDLLYLGSFGRARAVRVGEERFVLEAVTSTFRTNTARLEVRLAGREEPIIAVREFSPKLYVPSRTANR